MVTTCRDRRCHRQALLTAPQPLLRLHHRLPGHLSIYDQAVECAVGVGAEDASRLRSLGTAGHGLSHREDRLDSKTDLRPGFDRFSPENIFANKPSSIFSNDMRRIRTTPAQISLAWVMVRKPFIVPVPGTRSVDHLRENLGALDVQLTRADIRSSTPNFPSSPYTMAA